MIANRQIEKLVAVITAAAVLLCLLAMWYPAAVYASASGSDPGLAMEYESMLFDTDNIMDIDIIMDEKDWEEMLQNAISETYYACDVVVNGTVFYNVGIRPKGNTSLSFVAADPDNDRYSFKLEFDKYVEGQTCWGLDKLILNNNYADATNSKEAIVYDMYRYLGVDASLYNYAEISVNGDYWGVYLALEAVEDSFLLRNYGVENGNLYKPEGMDKGMDKETEKGMGRGGFGSSGGADLNYTDEELESYSTIWEGEVTRTSDEDHRRVVTALKNISEGTNLESCMDIDNLLKYMAVHSFAVNEDSLSGSMAHNYYLYEYNGRLNILPWDYNLAFGGMEKQNSASGMINDPIDTPFSGTQFFDALLENEEYLERYHAYYRQLVEEYVFGGSFEETFRRIRMQIDELVGTDPNAMYSYEEYEAAVNMLYDTVMLRGESVLGQLDGTIPSTSEGQRENGGTLLAASEIDVSVMGKMSMGGDFGDGGHDRRREQDAVPVMAEGRIPEGEGPGMEELPETKRQFQAAGRPGQEEEMLPGGRPGQEEEMLPGGRPGQEEMLPEGRPGQEEEMRPEGRPGQEREMPQEAMPEPGGIFVTAALLVIVLLATFLFAKYDRRKACRKACG